jgi:hypothetical protein
MNGIRCLALVFGIGLSFAAGCSAARVTRESPEGTTSQPLTTVCVTTGNSVASLKSEGASILSAMACSASQEPKASEATARVESALSGAPLTPPPLSGTIEIKELSLA